MTKQEFIPKGNKYELHQSVQTKWRSPSNIALIKYWGKKPGQIPQNPSLSITLSAAYSETSIHFIAAGSGKLINFLFEGKPEPNFARRIQRVLGSFEAYLPFLQYFDLHIESKNSFPHSAGIASSASAMSALALCLVDAENQISGSKMEEGFFFRKASFLARLASGSAARSVYGGMVLWGNIAQRGSNDFAIPAPVNIHQDFKQIQDTILIVDRERKEVSSSKGHELMNNHAFAAARFVQAKENMDQLLKILPTGDWDSFIKIVENEALSLHAMMMTAEESYTLLKADSLRIIEKIKAFRKQSRIPLCYSLDAGPNIHLLYPKRVSNEVHGFIQEDLYKICKSTDVLYDQEGNGPQKLTDID